VCCATLFGCAGTQPVEPPDEGGGIDVAAPATGSAGVAAASDAPTAPEPASAAQPMAAGAGGGAADSTSDQEPADEFADVPSAASATPQESQQEPNMQGTEEPPPVEEPGDGDGDVADATADETPPAEVDDEPPVETVCGDGVIEGDEECEGANLNGMLCETLSAGAGLLACDLLTCRFDTSLCIPPLLRCGRFGCAFPTFP
jgi:hypothetical protein